MSADHVRTESIASITEPFEFATEVKAGDEPPMPEQPKTATADVRVFARFRPMNDRENDLSAEQNKRTYKFSADKPNTIEMMRPPGSVTVTEKEFTFDGIFAEDTPQSQIYETVAKPMVTDVLNGYNATLMAYGQTGSGKSHTMTGRIHSDEHQGIIPRMVHDIFEEIAERKERSVFSVQCSYVEIYLEKVRDLLNPALDNLKLREIISKKFNKAKKLKSVKSCVYIEGCTLVTVKTLKDILKVMKRGDSNRITAATEMNDRSSRSHAVFVVNITQTDVVKQTRKSSKLFLVDLAGSEQVDRSGATGLTLEQAKKINKSLSALSLVIQSLVEKKEGSHIPYRDSKLTRLLTDSLGGNSKTALILAMSPSLDSIHETYSTLGFGSRAKKMENKATVNEELTVGTYKKLVAAMSKDLDAWKLKYEQLAAKYEGSQLAYEGSQRAYAQLEQECTRLQSMNEADASAEIKKWKVQMGMVRSKVLKCANNLRGSQELPSPTPAPLEVQQESIDTEGIPVVHPEPGRIAEFTVIEDEVGDTMEHTIAEAVDEHDTMINDRKPQDVPRKLEDMLHDRKLEDMLHERKLEDKPERRPSYESLISGASGNSTMFDDLAVFTTGNLVVLGTDTLFTFERIGND